MPGPAAIWQALESALHDTFSPASAYGGPALFGALAFCALYYVGRRRARGRQVNMRAFLRSIFPRRVLLHPSSLIDMRLWALNAIVFASAYGMLGFGLFFWRDAIVAWLTREFGPHAPVPWPAWTTFTLATVLQILAYELAYWSAHYAFHKIPALWEFHKVHHSAEVMTTLTELRQHPVEIIAFMNWIGLATGIVFGVMTYSFRSRRAPVHAAQRQHPHDDVPPDLRASEAQQPVDTVHRRRGPHPAESGPSPAASLRQPRAFRQKPRLCARHLGLGVRHARDTFQEPANRSCSAWATRRRRSVQPFPPLSRPAHGFRAMR